MFFFLLCFLIPLISSIEHPNFTTTNGTNFINRGEIMKYGGTNCFYLLYESDYMIDALFKDAYDMKMQVVRLWAFYDVETPPTKLKKESETPPTGLWNPVWIQYYDRQNKSMVINTQGEYGLPRLDYIIYSARKHQIKVVLSLCDNWEFGGGVEMYNKWFGFSDHRDFFTQQQTRDAFKNFMNVLVNRKNTYTGDVYKKDDTILAFELLAEPRCEGCPTSVVKGWLEEMSIYFKEINKNQLLCIGDEGFLNRTGATDWPYNGKYGMDFDEYMEIPGIDFGSVHLYPDWWNKDYDNFPHQWIQDHSADRYNKPVVLQEFGVKDKSRRLNTYRNWLNDVEKYMSGWHYWMLSSWEDGGKTKYPDHDGFTVYYDPSDPVSQLLSSKSHRYKFYDDV